MGYIALRTCADSLVFFDAAYASDTSVVPFYPLRNSRPRPKWWSLGASSLAIFLPHAQRTGPCSHPISRLGAWRMGIATESVGCGERPNTTEKGDATRHNKRQQQRTQQQVTRGVFIHPYYITLIYHRFVLHQKRAINRRKVRGIRVGRWKNGDLIRPTILLQGRSFYPMQSTFSGSATGAEALTFTLRRLPSLPDAFHVE